MQASNFLKFLIKLNYYYKTFAMHLAIPYLTIRLLQCTLPWAAGCYKLLYGQILSC